MISRIDIEDMTDAQDEARQVAALDDPACVRMPGVFRLGGDARVTRRCATEGCFGQPTYRLEAGGTGSDYCSGCAAALAAMDTPKGGGDAD